MNVQPKPSPASHHMPTPREATGDRVAAGLTADVRQRVPAAGPRLVFTWPVEFEVEPWRP